MTRIRLPAILCAIASLTACSTSKPATDAAAQPSPRAGTVDRPGVAVRFATVEHRSLTGSIVASGEVVSGAGGQANLAFPIAGQIANISVAIGDHVTTGESLAELDGRIARRDVAQSAADVAAAAAQLAKARAGARPQEIAQNIALVTGADARLRTAQLELRRQASLASVGIASRRDVEQAQGAYADALAALRDKQQSGSLLAAGPRTQDIDVARAQLAQAQSMAATARTRASLLTLVAPFDGVVTARPKNEGEIVDTSSTVLMIVNPAKALVAVQLSEDQAAAVRAGDRAVISINGEGAPIAGRVATVNASLDPVTRTLQAFVVPAGGASLRPGSTASATIVVRTLADAIVVPSRAIVKDPDTGQALVFTKTRDGTYRRVPVRVALQTAKYAAVTGSRLRTVTRVVTDGAYELLPFATGGGD